MTADEATLDLLFDLQHDLGKYLLLPLGLLPQSADGAALRDAVRRALCETRRRGEQVESARDVWARFERELERDPTCARSAALPRLRAAMAQALAWEAALDQDGALERAAVQRDFAAVKQAIAALSAEVRGG